VNVWQHTLGKNGSTARRLEREYRDWYQHFLSIVCVSDTLPFTYIPRYQTHHDGSMHAHRRYMLTIANLKHCDQTLCSIRHASLAPADSSVARFKVASFNDRVAQMQIY
jgi:hypothetical protein